MLFISSIAAPQDAHTRLVLQVYLDSILSSPNKYSLLDYLATKPEVEGSFSDQGVVLPEVESLKTSEFVAS